MNAFQVFKTGLILTMSACLAFPAHADFVAPATPATMPSLTAVRLLDGPFADAVRANRTYLLALEPDRLLAPFFRENGLEPKAHPYGNWESIGLVGLFDVRLMKAGTP